MVAGEDLGHDGESHFGGPPAAKVEPNRAVHSSELGGLEAEGGELVRSAETEYGREPRAPT